MVTAPIIRSTAPHSIVQAYNREKSTWDKLWIGIGKALTWLPTALRTAVGYLLTAVRLGLTYLLRGITEGPVWLAGKIFGVDTKSARDFMSKLWTGVFAAVTGLLDGVLRIPEAAIGAATTYLHDFFSFRWIKQPSYLIRLLTEPVLDAVWCSLGSPLVTGLRTMDDALHPGRAVTAAERAMLCKEFPAGVVDAIRIHDSSSWTWALFANGAAAQTIGYDIFCDAGTLSDEILRHECVHVLQYRDTPGGNGIFLTNYFADFFAKLAATGNVFEAYSQIDDEAQAYELEHGFNQHATTTATASVWRRPKAPTDRNSTS